MDGIDKIIIKNFKAFPEEETIELNGKHLLLYGENGSGKSSIYWALYTLFQAKDKGSVLTRKYFDRTNPEHLLNIFTDNDDSYIKFSLTDEPSVFYKLDIHGLNTEGSSAKTDDVLEGLNSNSDFISHRLLISFYHFRNSHEINLWTIFERDILPFIKINRGRGNKTLAQLYKEISNSRPFRLLTNGKIENKKVKVGYTRKINEFNQDLVWWITEINQEVNTFYQSHFQNPEEEKIEIKLKYETGDYLTYGHLQQIRKVANTEYSHKSKDIRALSTPFIGLSLKAVKKDSTEFSISRPQSYLNEAKLTAIALSVRFSLLADHIRIPYSGKILALDDLLISLDMNNRDRVLDVILNEFAQENKYNVYIFTHDRAFFEMAKNRILFSQRHDDNNWQIYEMYPQKDSNYQRRPKNYFSKDHIARAKQHLYETHDYPASANYLRKATEDILFHAFPAKIFKNEIGTDKKKLDQQLLASIVFLQRFEIDPRTLERLREFVSVLLNPLSHKSDNYSTVYKEELEKIIEIIENIQTSVSSLRFDEILPRQTKIKLQITKNATTNYNYITKIKDDLYLFRPPVGVPVVSKCQLERDLICYEVVNGIKGADNSLNAPLNQCSDLRIFYEIICNKEGIILHDNHLEFFYKTDGNIQLSTL